MTTPLVELLQIPSKELYIEFVLTGMLKRTLPTTQLVQLLFTSADQGDAVALAILRNSAQQLANSTVGCLHNLDFDHEVDVILAGSVWVKPESPLLLDMYKSNVAATASHDCQFMLLQVPPATDAVLWALELTQGGPVDATTRKKVIASVEQHISV